MQAIIDADMQAHMDEGCSWEAEAARQRETGRLAVAGTKRQACRQPTGRHDAEGGSQVGAGSRHAVRQAVAGSTGRQAGSVR
jgi:hypothetical protein